MEKDRYDKDCFYCTRDQRQRELMTEVCRLERSTVYLFNDQLLKGRCVVAYNEHYTELFQLPPEDRNVFMNEVSTAAEVVWRLFRPQKINYAVFGDIVSHIHFHIVPKYENGPLWGFPYFANPGSVKTLSDQEFQQLLMSLKEEFNSILS